MVIGETAVVGDNCSLLHGVSLGGSGLQSEIRHPQLGDGVLIGASATILGSVRIGNGVKIGAGSVVMSDVPDGCTAVGVPAKILKPRKDTIVDAGLEMDHTIQDWSDYMI